MATPTPNPTTFTRGLYDSVKTQMDIDSKVNLSDRNMDNSIKENNNRCFNINGFRNSQSEVSRPNDENGRLNIAQKVEIETHLQNRHLELNSLDRTNRDYEKFTVNNSANCSIDRENMSNVDTRHTHPIVNYRGMYTADYNFTPYLHIDKQAVHAESDNSPLRGGNSTRLEAKDNFQPNSKSINFKNIANELLPKKK